MAVPKGTGSPARRQPHTRTSTRSASKSITVKNRSSNLRCLSIPQGVPVRGLCGARTGNGVCSEYHARDPSERFTGAYRQFSNKARSVTTEGDASCEVGASLKLRGSRGFWQSQRWSRRLLAGALETVPRRLAVATVVATLTGRRFGARTNNRTPDGVLGSDAF